MPDRDAFVRKLEAQLKEWSAKLDELRRRAEKAAASRQGETAKQIEALQERRDAIARRLQELRTAGEHAWEELRAGAEKAWEEMATALDSAVARVRARPSGGRRVTVGELMTKDPGACRPHDALNAAARILWEYDCGCVPVIGEGSRVVGVITDRDICMAGYTRNRPLAEIEVGSAMSKDVVACRAGDPVDVAEERMRSRQVRRLPVTEEDGRLVGVLSLNDLARAAARELEGRGRGRVRADGVLRTLAAIGETRAASSAAS